MLRSVLPYLEYKMSRTEYLADVQTRISRRTGGETRGECVRLPYVSVRITSTEIVLLRPYPDTSVQSTKGKTVREICEAALRLNDQYANRAAWRKSRAA